MTAAGNTLAWLRKCNYAHLGGCSAEITHRVDYWRGEARKVRGPWAYFCAVHAIAAQHLPLERIKRGDK